MNAVQNTVCFFFFKCNPHWMYWTLYFVVSLLDWFLPILYCCALIIPSCGFVSSDQENIDLCIEEIVGSVLSNDGKCVKCCHTVGWATGRSSGKQKYCFGSANGSQLEGIHEMSLRRSGVARIVKGYHSFTCTPCVLSASGMSHT